MSRALTAGVAALILVGCSASGGVGVGRQGHHPALAPDEPDPSGVRTRRPYDQALDDPLEPLLGPPVDDRPDAEQERNYQQARTLYEEGRAAFEAGRHIEARVRLMRSIRYRTELTRTALDLLDQVDAALRAAGVDPQSVSAEPATLAPERARELAAKLDLTVRHGDRQLRGGKYESAALAYEDAARAMGELPDTLARHDLHYRLMALVRLSRRLAVGEAP